MVPRVCERKLTVQPDNVCSHEVNIRFIADSDVEVVYRQTVLLYLSAIEHILDIIVRNRPNPPSSNT